MQTFSNSDIINAQYAGKLFQHTTIEMFPFFSKKIVLFFFCFFFFVFLCFFFVVVVFLLHFMQIVFDPKATVCIKMSKSVFRRKIRKLTLACRVLNLYR